MTSRSKLPRDPKPQNRQAFEALHLRSFTTPVDQPPVTYKDAISALLTRADNNNMNVGLEIVEEEGTVVLLVLDRWLGNKEVERIPAFAISAPTFRCGDRDPTMDNLLMFRVDANSVGPDDPKTNELHIFKITDMSARNVVSALIDAGANSSVENSFSQMSISDRDYNQHRGSHSSIASRSSTLPGRSTTGSMFRMTPQSQGSPAQGDYRDYDLTEEDLGVPLVVETELIDKEVKLLNLTFDDIEKTHMLMRDKQVHTERRDSAIALMSKASTGLVSTMPRNPKKKLEKIFAIDLSARVKDLFAKQKFGIILLSRLHGFVVNPHPPDTLRTLFGLVAEAIKLTEGSDINLPTAAADTVHPRFPQETLEFMYTNLEPFHKRILEKLGPNWTAPREGSSEDEVYIPVFMQNFKVIPSSYDRSLFEYNKMSEDEKRRGRYIAPAAMNPFVRKLIDQGANFARAVHAFQTNRAEELAVNKGDFVELLETTGNWYRCRNDQNQVGYCPNNVLRIIANKRGDIRKPPLTMSSTMQR